MCPTESMNQTQGCWLQPMWTLMNGTLGASLHSARISTTGGHPRPPTCPQKVSHQIESDKHVTSQAVEDGACLFLPFACGVLSGGWFWGWFWCTHPPKTGGVHQTAEFAHSARCTPHVMTAHATQFLCRTAHPVGLLGESKHPYPLLPLLLHHPLNVMVMGECLPGASLARYCCVDHPLEKAPQAQQNESQSFPTKHIAYPPPPWASTATVPKTRQNSGSTPTPCLDKTVPACGTHDGKHT